MRIKFPSVSEMSCKLGMTLDKLKSNTWLSYLIRYAAQSFTQR